MLILLSALVLAAPPLEPGVHRCGVQWSSYSEFCTVTVEGDVATIESRGPSTRIKGKLTRVNATEFSFDGELTMLAAPIGYGDLSTCAENGPYRFLKTGKRKYLRHTQTCSDMTTSYFDVFFAKLAPADVPENKKLSALSGQYALDDAANTCAPVAELLVRDRGSVACEHWNDSGLGSAYYACHLDEDNTFYVFETARQCETLRAARAR